MKNAEQVLSLVRPALLSLKPYSSARDEFDQAATDRDLIFLDANENPYPTPFNRYPDPHQRELKKLIGSTKSIADNCIFLGNGSDEAIDLIIRAFCRPTHHNVIIPAPTYGMYSVSADINEVETRSVSLTSSFDLDINAVLRAADENTRVVFLCSPNNPTGNALTRNLVEKLIDEFSGVVVVDEAYVDFSNEASLLNVIGKKPNLIILQTLSKAWGLAGLRLGMAFGHPQVIALLDKIKPPYNISSLAQKIAIDTLKKPENKKRQVNNILQERERMADSLGDISTVSKVFPSQANFLLVKMKDAARAYQHLINAGIVVRDRSRVSLCEGCLRITIGTEEENSRLLSALSSL